MPTVHGKVDGLRRADVRTIERLSRRRMGEGEILSAAFRY